VIGAASAISIINCDLEGMTGGSGSIGIVLAPVSGNTINGVSIAGCYFEMLKGNSININGSDGDSVRGVAITGCMFGGNSYGSPYAATYYVYAKNCSGLSILSNSFRWLNTGAIYIDSGVDCVDARMNAYSNGKTLLNNAGSATNVTSTPNHALSGAY
jgi:hypothetical protein